MAKRDRKSEGIDPTMPPADGTPREPIPRFSIPLNAGRIDWERMRPGSRDQLVALVKDDPQLARPAAAPTSGGPDIFNDAWCGMIYDALGQLEIAIAQRVYHCTAEQAAVLLYTDADRMMLSGPTARVLNKYGSVLFARYSDEIGLAMLVGSTTLMKVSTLRAQLAATPPAENGRALESATRPRSTRPPAPVRVEWPSRADAVPPRVDGAGRLDVDATAPASAPDGPSISS